MPAPQPPQPTRFAVQRARGKSWKTIFVDEDIANVDRAMKEVIRLNAKGCFRLIRLDHNPEAKFDGLEFNWKLIALHAPRNGQLYTGLGGSGPTTAAAAGAGPNVRRTSGPSKARPAGARRVGERVAVPFLLYGLVAVLGAAIAVILYLKFGSAGGSLAPPRL
ncbi:MAG: hypothetical protein GC191_06935 [Azospirillum sp.]|nr:hypothetical protein [Azospirillum sp.]